MRSVWLLVLIPIAYLIGSVPFGLMIGKARGIDPRTAGSGNIGATNLGRLLGGKFFALVFTLDLLKGMVPVLAAGAVLRFAPQIAQDYLLWLAVGAAAIFGHMFSVFLGFKGGKGVATSAGVLLGVFPYYTLPGLIAVAVWGLVFQVSRYVSLASMIGAALFPIAYVVVGLALGWPVTNQQWPLLGFAILIPALIVYKHRGNIARLRAGTESRFAKRAQ
jgi:acyl phosphate:glycerol-3-phosphate acyltransferase